MAVSLMFAAACSEDEITREKSPAQNPNSDNVYFDAANPKSFVLDMDVTEFSVVVKREVAVDALDVSLKLLSSYDNGLFTIPNTISFAAGENSKTLTVTLGNIKLMTNYHFSIVIDGDQTNPYTVQNVYPVIELNVLKEDYAPFAEGTYYSAIFDESWTQVLHKSQSTTKYRFFNLYNTGFHFTFIWTGTASITPVGTKNASGYYIYIPGITIPAYGTFSVQVDSDPKYTFYDAASDAFQFEGKWGATLNGVATNFGWLDDTYTITTRY